MLLAYNATDPEYVAALDAQGRFLAWLEAEELSDFAPWSSKTKEKIGESMEIRRGLEKATKQSLRFIADSARASGARSAQEMLYDRLQLPATAQSLVTQAKIKARLQPGNAVKVPMTPTEVAEMILRMEDGDAAAPASAADIASDFLKNLEKLA